MSSIARLMISDTFLIIPHAHSERKFDFNFFKNSGSSSIITSISSKNHSYLGLDIYPSICWLEFQQPDFPKRKFVYACSLKLRKRPLHLTEPSLLKIFQHLIRRDSKLLRNLYRIAVWKFLQIFFYFVKMIFILFPAFPAAKASYSGRKYLMTVLTDICIHNDPPVKSYISVENKFNTCCFAFIRNGLFFHSSYVISRLCSTVARKSCRMTSTTCLLYIQTAFS